MTGPGRGKPSFIIHATGSSSTTDGGIALFVLIDYSLSKTAGGSRNERGITDAARSSTLNGIRDNEMEFLGKLTLFLALALWATGLSGCRNDGGTSKRGGPSTDGKLYVANAGDGSLLAFDQAVSAEGNIAPSRRFPESITGPTGIFLDRSSDTLYIANTDHDSILIYENAGALNLSTGSADATRVISGPKTGLNRPSGVAYDAARDRLYVANRDGRSISVFQKDCPEANLLNGDIPPCRTLSGAATLLDLPQALAVDTRQDILYIANLGNHSILAYGNASQSATRGNLAPTRTITPHGDPSRSESLLHRPAGLFVDSANDRLYVVNAGGNPPAIFVYENARSKSGGTIPDRLLSGQNTQLAGPAGIDLSVDRDRLYVLDNNNASSGSTAVVVFDNFDGRCAPSPCNLAPSRVITGQRTGLVNATGIAYDPAHEVIYVANTLANDILIFALEGDLPPLKINTGVFQTTGLLQPNGFFYDAEIDRLYIANFNAASGNSPPIIVYENVSTKVFPAATATRYDWAVGGSDIQRPRRVYVDKTRQRLMVLNTPIDKVLIYDLAALDSATKSGGAITPLPSPAGTLIGFTLGTAMAVDETNGFLYVAADCPPSSSDCPNQQPNGNSIFIYNLNNLAAPPRVIGRGCVGRNNTNSNNRGCETFDNIKLNRPFGLHYDSAKDILYVTNVGANGSTANSILAFHHPSSLGGTLAECDAAVASNPTVPSPCANIAPNRMISSSATFSDSERLQSPIAPFVNPAADRLFLINRAKDALFIFENASARSGETRPDRIISGASTQLSFSGTSDFTGALFVDTTQGKETLYIGQPKEPGCDCPNGAFLVFGVEGDVPPSRTWSGGGAALTVPSALAVDTTRDILYVANQGDAAQTADDSLSILTEASRANGNLPMTGALSVTTGSAGVTGTGTIFTTEFATGDSIKIGTGTYTIATIASDTSLIPTTPYTGASDTEVPASLRPRRLCSPSSVVCGAPDVKLNNPAGLFVDPEENHLYVSNTGTDPNCGDAAMPCNAILVFYAAGNLNNNGVPGLVLTSAALNSPRGLALDSERNILYVANNGGHSVLAFKGIKGRTGPVTATPDAEIVGTATGINAPVGVAIDSGRDILYVLSQGTREILVFEQASALNGDGAPTRVLAGGNFMQTPAALFLDAEGDLLYVADKGENQVYIFTNASQAEGEAPHKTIAGNNTGLKQPAGLAVDTAR